MYIVHACSKGDSNAALLARKGSSVNQAIAKSPGVNREHNESHARFTGSNKQEIMPKMRLGVAVLEILCNILVGDPDGSQARRFAKNVTSKVCTSVGDLSNIPINVSYLVVAQHAT